MERLFSAPVPKPVLVASLQVTTLPDCIQAAAADPVEITTVTADSSSGAASTSVRSVRPFGVSFAPPLPVPSVANGRWHDFARLLPCVNRTSAANHCFFI